MGKIPFEALKCLKHDIECCIECAHTLGAIYKIPEGYQPTDVDMGNSAFDPQLIKVQTDTGEVTALPIEPAAVVEENPKLCVNCVNIATVGSGDWERFKCMAPENFTGINPVTGDKVYGVPLCVTARVFLPVTSNQLDNDPRYCGSQGKWFKQKEERPSNTSLAEPPTFSATDLENLGKKAAERVAALKNKQRGGVGGVIGTRSKASQFENL